MQTLTQADFAARLRQVMKALGIQGVTLAARTGFSPTTISRWRRPTYIGPPKLAYQRRIERAVNLPEGAFARSSETWTTLLKSLKSRVGPIREAGSVSRYGMAVTERHEAAGELAASAGEVAAMVGDAVGRALRRVIATNELEGTRAGRRDLVLVLRRLAHDLHAMGADVSDLFVAIDYLQGDKRDEGRDP
jgi:transcriptional regulator with XRE-family HTH domain